MACDLATVLLALKLANAQIAKTEILTPQTSGSSWAPIPNSPAFHGGTATSSHYPVTGTAATPAITMGEAGASLEEELMMYERLAKSARDKVAAEKKRKDDKAFIDKTLKECGKQK